MAWLTFTNLLVLTGCVVLYFVSLATYRLFFSPIAKFPGPKLAAVSYWYEGYWDVIKPGQYVWRIKEMHEKYGQYLMEIPRKKPDHLQ